MIKQDALLLFHRVATQLDSIAITLKGIVVDFPRDSRTMTSETYEKGAEATHKIGIIAQLLDAISEERDISELLNKFNETERDSRSQRTAKLVVLPDSLDGFQYRIFNYPFDRNEFANLVRNKVVRKVIRHGSLEWQIKGIKQALPMLAHHYRFELVDDQGRLVKILE